LLAMVRLKSPSLASQLPQGSVAFTQPVGSFRSAIF
jgi:hypothetical protein